MQTRVPMKFKQKLTIWQLANHEFVRALRVMRRNTADIEIWQLLINERRKVMNNFLRAMLGILAALIWIESHNDQKFLEFEIWSMQLSLPVIYIAFVVSLVLFGAITSAFSYIYINEFVRVAAHKMFHFDNSTALALPYEGDSAWSIGASIQFRFLKSSRAHTAFGLITLAFILIPLGIIIFFVYVRTYGIIFDNLLNPTDVAFDRVLSVVSALLLLHPPAWIMLQWIPFSFHKNISFIRWNFLFRIYQKEGKQFSKTTSWLKDK